MRRGSHQSDLKKIHEPQEFEAAMAAFSSRSFILWENLVRRLKCFINTVATGPVIDRVSKVHIRVHIYMYMHYRTRPSTCTTGLVPVLQA